MKKSFKIILILVIMLGIVFVSNAQATSSLTWDSIKGTADKWTNAGGSGLINDSTLVNTVVPVGQMLTAIGVVVLFGALVVLGIKYMIADPEQKGKLKGQLIGVVVSGVVIFGAYTIWKIAYNFFEEMF